MAAIAVLPSRLGAADGVRKAQESVRWHPRYRAEAPLPKQPAAVAAAIAARRSEFRAAIAPGGGKLGMSSSMPALGTTTRVWAQDEWVAKTLAACPAGSGATQLPKLSAWQRQAEVPGSTAAPPALSYSTSPGSRMGSRPGSPNTEWQSQTLASLTARLDETPGSPPAVPAAARSLPSTPASPSCGSQRRRRGRKWGQVGDVGRLSTGVLSENPASNTISLPAVAAPRSEPL